MSAPPTLRDRLEADQLAAFERDWIGSGRQRVRIGRKNFRAILRESGTELYSREVDGALETEGERSLVIERPRTFTLDGGATLTFPDGTTGRIAALRTLGKTLLELTVTTR